MQVVYVVIMLNMEKYFTAIIQEMEDLYLIIKGV